MVFAQYYEALKITDNLYGFFWQGRGNNCNAYLFTDVLEGERPHVIIDPGYIVNEFREPCFKQLTAAMKMLDLDPQDTGLILNTHAHPDHCAAGEMLTQNTVKTKPPLIAFAWEEYAFLRTLKEKASRAAGLFLEKLEPFFLLDEGSLNLGKITLQVLITPGHSPGGACFYWPEQKILFSGDVVFYGSVGRTDLPGGSLSQLQESIERLSGLDVECLLPGHFTQYGAVIRGREKVIRNFQAIKMFFV